MKKEKTISRQIPIQLSANKKGSSLNLRHEQQLFTPYKIEWKNTHEGNTMNTYKEPLRNLQSNITSSYLNGNTSKTFYQNMKNELLNIKQDVQKMILKERKQKSISLIQPSSLSGNGYIKTINIKNKCQKKGKYETITFQNKINNNKIQYEKNNNVDEDGSLVSQIQRNQYEMRKKQKQIYPRIKSKSIADVITFTEKANNMNSGKYTERCQDNNSQTVEETVQKVDQTHQKIQLDINLPLFIKKSSSNNDQIIESFRDQLTGLQKQLTEKQQELKNKNSIIFNLNEDMNKQRQQHENLRKTEQAVLTRVKDQNGQLHQLIQEKCMDLNKLSNVITNQNKEIQRLVELNHQLQLNKDCFSSNRIKNENLEQENKKLKQKMKLKENQLYIYQEELKQARQKIRQYKDFQKSQEKIIEKVKVQYKQVIDPKLKQENQSMRKEILRLNQLNQQMSLKLSVFSRQNNELKQKILKLETGNKDNFENMMKNQSFSNIGEEISNKLSEMVNENYSLKNKIAHLQANVEQLNFHNRSLKEEVRIYEEKSHHQKQIRTLKIQDWDILTDQRDQLKNQNDKLKQRLQEIKQFYELQTMKKQNQVSELKVQIQQFIDFGDEQQSELHPNLRSIKHISNFSQLLNEFRDMIDYNLEMQENIRNLEQKLSLKSC